MRKWQASGRWKNGTRSGYSEFRYGADTGNPISLPEVSILKKPAPILRGEKRKAAAGKALDLMRQWRHTPFEREGAVLAGLRSGFCLWGYGWQRSNAEAAAIVATCLRLLGAERPTWLQGQPEYVIPRENCQRCGTLLPLSDIGNYRRFCSDVCARSAMQCRSDYFSFVEQLSSRQAAQVARKAAAKTRICVICNKEFKSLSQEQLTCSRGCGAKSRPDYVPPRECEACGKTFRGRSKSSRFCSIQCISDAQRAALPEKNCDQCGKLFQPGKPSTRFCSRQCTQRNHYERKKAERKAAAASNHAIQKLFDDAA